MDPQQIIAAFEANKISVKEAMTQMVNGFDPNDPDRLFVEWLGQNYDGLQAGCQAVGMPPLRLGQIIACKGPVIAFMEGGKHEGS